MSRLLRRSTALLATTATVLVTLLALTTAPAHAAWTTFANLSGKSQILVCKTAIDSPYGPLWKVSMVVATSPDYSGSMTFRVRRGSSIVQNVSLSARNGAWDVKETYASRYWNDTWQASFGVGQISTGQGYGQSMSSPTSFNSISVC